MTLLTEKISDVNSQNWVDLDHITLADKDRLSQLNKQVFAGEKQFSFELKNDITYLKMGGRKNIAKGNYVVDFEYRKATNK